MKASHLIALLADLITEHGDADVVADLGDRVGYQWDISSVERDANHGAFIIGTGRYTYDPESQPQATRLQLLETALEHVSEEALLEGFRAAGIILQQQSDQRAMREIGREYTIEELKEMFANYKPGR